MSGAERRDVAGGHLLGDGGGVTDEGSVPPWHDVEAEAEIAAALDPLVVWLGEYGADQSDQGVAIGEDPDHVGATVDLAVEPLSRVLRPDLAPISLTAVAPRSDSEASSVKTPQER